MAAEIGHSEAQYRMSSRGLEKNIRKRTQSLFRAAAQGHRDALYRLGSAYRNSYGDYELKEDASIGNALLREAAALNHPEALFELEMSEVKDFQDGIKKARALEAVGNTRAKEYLEGIMNMSADALDESSNGEITAEDLAFLRTLGWKDERD
jgi:TPR repeat protein